VFVFCCLDRITEIQRAARQGSDSSRPPWPLLVLRTPKGWTGPPVVDGQPVEGTFRAHQVPLPAARDNDDHREVLEAWRRSYRPEVLFDDAGRPVPELLELAPTGGRRMSANPVANGGRLLRDLRLPDWREYGVDVERPGGTRHEATRVLGAWLRDVTRRNPDNFLTFAPDELASNRLQDILEVTGRDWQAEVAAADEKLDRAGRGSWRSSPSTSARGLLEGYLLTAGTAYLRREPGRRSWG
jgi:xylulose-5-phosphate/fructose-6-phosphate phosphoketolase